jgi:hypothetical protein
MCTTGVTKRRDLHALYPQCHEEDDKRGEDEGKGTPDKLTEERLLRRDAEVRHENRHLDGAGSKDEQCLSSQRRLQSR